MKTMELESLKAEVARVILNSDDEALLYKTLRLFGKNSTIESIPGLPSTPEQLIESVGRAQKQRKQGLGVSHKDAFQQYEEMYKGLPGW